ncbi:MAG: aminodeoxychorismate/anthranilate synthase component II [Ignavibacteriales bacterium]|nr:aminodeoxychorismate/anthranilate synthase component II [Ignavibacteriales bacterium]
MKNKILIIDNYDSFTYNLLQIVEEFHYDYLLVKNDQLNYEIADQSSKILISPGPGLPSESGMITKVISKYASSKKILGVCLGHQAIAEAFGGELYNLPIVRHGIRSKIKTVSPEDYLFENIPSEFDAGLYHSWAISKNKFPDCLKITSVGTDDVIMSISHKEYDVIGVQFHPESVMTVYGKQIIQNWLKH